MYHVPFLDFYKNTQPMGIHILLFHIHTCQTFLYYSQFSQHTPAKNNRKGKQTHCIPEGVHLEPLQQLLANFHGVWQEGPVGQQEVFNVCGVHYWGFLHQVHDQTFWGSLRVGKRHTHMRKHTTHMHISQLIIAPQRHKNRHMSKWIRFVFLDKFTLFRMNRSKLQHAFVDSTVDVSGGNDSSDREQKLEMHPLLPAAKGGKV